MTADPDDLRSSVAAAADTDTLLELLQKAAEEQQRILERQSRLIAELRAELRGPGK